jgi:hypothetical protein
MAVEKLPNTSQQIVDNKRKREGQIAETEHQQTEER